MGLLDRVKNRVNKRAQVNIKTPTGSSTVFYLPTDNKKNIDLFQQSKSMTAVVTKKTALLSSLPLKAYRLKDRTGSKSQRNGRALKAIAGFSNRALNGVGFSAVDLNLEEVQNHPLLSLLNYVNNFWTWYRLIAMSETSLAVWGKTYWKIERAGDKPVELWWLKSDYVKPIVDSKKYISKYSYKPPWLDKPKFYSIQDIVAFSYPNIKDEFSGLSPMMPVKTYAKHELASMKANSKLHEQGLNLGGVIYPMHGQIWSKAQALQIEEDVARRFAGVDKTHSWGVFRHEVGLKEMGMTPSDSQFLEGMDADLAAVCQIFNMPVELFRSRKAGATRENITAAMLEAYTFSVIPEAVMISSEITKQMVRDYDDIDLVAFDFSGVPVLLSVIKDRWEIEKEKIQAGVLTVDEWRKANGYPAIKSVE